MSLPLPKRRFTVDEYLRMAELGILSAGERLELIEGEIIQMAAMGSPHAACVSRLTQLLTRGVGDRALVRVQCPIHLSDLSAPEPDLALVRPREDHYASAHPGADDVLLLIEVGETTVEFDRGAKAALYARAGIAEYWLVDLPASAIDVFREPGTEGYRDVRRYRAGDLLRPAALPALDVLVEAVLG